jgi:hypothetical protein
MPTKFSHVTIRPSQGGALVVSPSADVAGSTSYTEKLNFRRDLDGEVRREGYELFNPAGLDVTPYQQCRPDPASSDPVRQLHQFADKNGRRVLVAAQGGKLYRFKFETTQDYAVSTYADSNYVGSLGSTYAWEEIATGLQTSRRWECVSFSGVCFFNNGADLPLYYDPLESSATAKPVYGLRELGIASVGTIAEYEGRLIVADIWEITTGFDAYWMNDSSVTDKYVHMHDHASVTTTGNVKLTRYPYRVRWSSYTQPTLFGQSIKGTTSNSGGDGYFETDYPLSFGNGKPESFNTGDSLSILNAGINGSTMSLHSFSNHDGVVQYVVEEPGVGYDGTSTVEVTSPTSGTTATGTMTRSASGGIQSIAVNVNGSGYYEAPVVTINKGSSSGYGATIRAVLGLEVQPSATTPLTITGATSVVNGAGKTVTKYTLSDEVENVASDCTMMLYDEIGAGAGWRDFTEDGSTILKFEKLGNQLYAYREGGYFVISATTEAMDGIPTVFNFDGRYLGERVANYRHTVINIGGVKHLFAGTNGVFEVTRASTEPKLSTMFEVGPEWWNTISTDEYENVYSVDNPITREVFICYPLDSGKGVVAYDYVNNTISEIDEHYEAAAAIMKPKEDNTGREEMWFVFWSDGDLVRYGFGQTGYRIYSRKGLDYTSRLRSGLIDFGDTFSDKQMRSYALQLSDVVVAPSNTIQIDPQPKIRLFTNSSVHGVGQNEVMDEVNNLDYVLLNDIKNENMIPLYLRANYYRDEIEVSGKDNPMKVVGRTFEVSKSDDRSTLQVIGQGAFPS